MDLNNNKHDDLYILTQLQEKGISFLEESFKNLEDSKEKDDIFYCVLNRFNMMYLENDDELFPNNYVSYINNIISNGGYLWDKVCELLDDDEIKEFMDIFNEYIKDHSFTNQLKIYKGLYNNKVISLLITNEDFYNSSILSRENFINLLMKFDDYSSSDKIAKLINNVVVFLKPIFNNEYSRYLFIELIEDILNENIGRGNNIYDNNMSPLVLISIFLIVHKIFYHNITNEKLENIDFSYIISNKCNIRWTGRHINDNKEYNLRTRLFFILLQSFRVGYIPNFDIIDYYREKLYYLNIQYINNAQLSTSVRINNIKKSMEPYEDIFNNYYVNKCIEDLINTISYITIKLDKRDININDDIFDMIITHYNSKVDNICFNDSTLIKLFVRIIATNTYVKNPHIRYKYLTFVKDSIYNDLFNTTNKTFVKRIVEGLITLYIQVSETTSIVYKSDILIFLINLTNVLDMKNSFENILDNNEDKLKKFILSIMNDYCKSLDIFKEDVKKLMSIEYINRNSVDKIVSYDKLILTYLRTVIKTFDLLTYISQNVRETLLSFELKNVFISLINKSLKDLNYNTYIIKIDKYNASFNVSALITNILKVCVNFDNTFTQELINNVYFQSDIYKTLGESKKIIKKCDMLFSNKLDVIIFFNNIKQVEEDTKVIDDDIDIPFELCDPLLCTLIEEPLFLPETDTVIDKKSIYTHLLRKEEHPFTRSKLTKDILHNYNERPDIIDRIKVFKEKVNEWKKSLK